MGGFISSSSTALFCLFILFLFGTTAAQGVFLSKLKTTLVVSASPKEGQVLKAGVDKITVSWHLNESLAAAGVDSSYKKVKLWLCYAPVSQKDRSWRKTVDEIKKDKTCQFAITVQQYKRSSTSYVYLVQRDVPSATYFVRAYLLDSSDVEVAYGQTTDASKGTNLFQITGITGRHASLDIAAGCFSAFSVVSLLFFFVLEKRKAKK